MDLLLTDKVVVVTGAASGIGGATARLDRPRRARAGVRSNVVIPGPTRTPLKRGSAVRAATTS
ncbi:hypothetical protein [Streptomyces mirabilis]|uniref:hypothetical protein n=1 Tax=Streptomyces mirabilis TaxID=68239 RepID=UPI00364D1A99